MMTSIALYLLGVIGAASAEGRDAPYGLREGAVVICWPLAVAVATVAGLFHFARARFRP